MLFREPRIDNDNELYQRYWSEFVEYYINNGLSLSSVGSSGKSYYFRMDNFR